MKREKNSKSREGVWLSTSVLWLTLCLVVLAVVAAWAGSEEEAWLQAHNSYRKQHQTPPLHWSGDLARSASSWAATCPSSHSRSGHGENIAWATYGQEPEQVVGRWYGEEKKYDYAAPGFSSATGHFTQVVWKGTTAVGCGCRSDCSSGYSDVCVCQYDPPGNYRSRFRENVLPPLRKQE